jgi:hypothetical protein
MIEIFIILPVVLHGCETWPLTGLESIGDTCKIGGLEENFESELRKQQIKMDTTT